MRISKAKHSDIEQIAHVELNSGYHKNKKFDALSMIKQFFSQKNVSIFITKEKSKIIGYITLRKHKNLGEIDFLAVIKKHQGKGVGQKLFKYVLDKASKLKIKKLLLEVRKDNKKAIGIYEKYGFKKIGTKRNKGIVKIIMAK